MHYSPNFVFQLHLSKGLPNYQLIFGGPWLQKGPSTWTGSVNWFADCEAINKVVTWKPGKLKGVIDIIRNNNLIDELIKI